LRTELSYVDYLGALERFRIEKVHRPDVLRMSSWLVTSGTTRSQIAAVSIREGRTLQC
jgi:hypothetical protein